MIPYFYENNIFYSKTVANLQSYSLSEFKGTHKLNFQIFDYFKSDSSLTYEQHSFKNSLKGGIWLSANPLENFQWIDQVEELQSDDVLNVVDGFDDFNFYKQQLYEILKNNLLKYRDDKNLLLLSGGVDSQLILKICLENNIPINCVHITYDTKLSSETNWLTKLQRKFNLPIEYELIPNLGKEYLEAIVRDYAIINPAYSYTTYVDLIMAAVLSQTKYKDFNNIFTGMRSEGVLGQSEIYLNELVANKALIHDYDISYGTYIQYYRNTTSFEQVEKIYGKDYRWLSQNKLKGTVAGRNLYALEKLSNKKLVYPFMSKKLHELALGLCGDAAIKNVYKIPQIELLGENYFRKTTIGETIKLDTVPWKNKYMVDECLKIWINNFLDLPLDTDPRTISL